MFKQTITTPNGKTITFGTLCLMWLTDCLICLIIGIAIGYFLK